MGKEVGNILKGQLLGPMEVEQKTYDHIMHVVSTPEMQANRRERTRLAIISMLEQDYECDWVNLHVKRQEHVVTIDWKFRTSAGDPGNYVVVGMIYEIDLSPTAGNMASGRIVNTRGNGSVRLELEEGCVYHMPRISKPRSSFFPTDVSTGSGIIFAPTKTLTRASRSQDRIRQSYLS
jgi:hypothetical protein